MEFLNPIVLPNDDGIRPAGKPDECFYCSQKVGTSHLASCVALHKMVKVRYTFDLEIEVPHSWTTDNIEFQSNDSSWCADNALDQITAYIEKEKRCCCGIFSCEVLDSNMQAIPYTKEKEK